ncbi:acyl carrier protein 1, chloroplastic-like [Tripterygium wilfordii]|uniref:acyl carrier protein 1, chloroplastic-like n=1 Tax=Tripterygium wilfordii TaxID=458696 RepID=UPI0018F80249|nr:acyl carrier protein 1, chloroplastic-like [Tripterygium wilfordii]
MALVTGASVAMSSLSLKPTQARGNRISSVNVVSLAFGGGSCPSLTMKPASYRFKQSCAAKPETVDKVCAIVRKQLAIAEDAELTGESKFAALGADSLDTVEIVMALEEAFDVTVEEDSAQQITNVLEAADLIEDMIQKKA